MTLPGTALLCILVGLLWTTSAGDICPYQECPCAAPEIYCQDLELTSFPTLSDYVIDGFTNLILDGNKISAVPAKGLLPNLTEISFTNNPILTIDEDAFQGSATTLQSLSFSGALFTRIPDAFRRLRGLKYLNIYNTAIQDWNNDSMKNIGQTMKTLDLRNVGLKEWPSWFQYFTNLTDLNIDDSNISSLPDNAFDNLASSLQGLSISNGSLTSVPEALLRLISLESLDLEYNTILDVTFIPQMSKITSLSLHNNKIADADVLSSAIKPFADCLLSLEIQNNELTVLPDLSFFARIGSLDFSHNLIFDTNSGGVPSTLYQLNLGHNQLPSIPPLCKDLASLTSLVLPYNSVTKLRGTEIGQSISEINLGHNLITELTEESFPRHSSIITLYLNSNPISVVSYNAFSNLPQLMTLDLQDTRISRLPLALGSLTSLRSLDMSNSANLVCTCAEKALSSWIVKVEDIKGNCGLLTIRSFFTSFSPSCP